MFLVGPFVFFLFFTSIIYSYLKKKNTTIDLVGKHAVITGGSSGIGKSVACMLTQMGAHVTIISRDHQRLNCALNEITNFRRYEGQKLTALSLDVCSDFALIQTKLKELETSMGPIFILFNCAGQAICGTLESLTENQLKDQLTLNTLGSMYFTKAALEGMKKQKSGHIVFTASQGAFLGIYGMSAYCASKFALRGFAEALQMEVEPFNIKVTVAFPPDTDTPGFANEEKTKPKLTKLICESGGLYQPEEVAKAIIKDMLDNKFMSSIGLDGFMLTVLNCGMTPIRTFLDLLIQVCLLGPFRLVAVCYYFYFKKVIKNYHKN